MKVLHLNRKPTGALHYSIERVFRDVRGAMDSGITVSYNECPTAGAGVLKLLENLRFARAAATGFDVIHITGDCHYLALVLPKSKTVLTIHDCGPLTHKTGVRRFILKYIWFLLPMSRVSRLTVISSSTLAELGKYVNCRALAGADIVPNPVSNSFVPACRAFNKARPRILQVGTKSNKNIPRLCAALSDIDCELRIVGEVDAQLREQITSSGVFFTSVSALSEAALVEEYCNCDIVSLVSTYEGFGLPIIEAQATGRPVVTSSILSMPEVAGLGACLVDPYSVDDIRSAFAKLRDDDIYREKVVTAGFENIRRFSATSIAAAYGKIYTSLLEIKGRR